MWIDDLVFRQSHLPFSFTFWIPEKPVVVLGSSNLASSEVHEDHCRSDAVEVLKRAGGGGTVVLYPGSLILSLGAWVKRPFHNKFYFELLNQAVIETLTLLDPLFAKTEQSGISDLSLDGQKFCGTSLFRSREFLMYQASILVELDWQLIDRYLKHPTKEPDYRAGRTHRDFLTSVQALHPKTSCADLCAFFSKHFEKSFQKNMGEELVPVNLEHLDYIKRRASHRAPVE